MKIFMKYSYVLVASLFFLVSCGGPKTSDLDELSESLENLNDQLDESLNEKTDDLSETTSSDLYVSKDGGFKIDFFGTKPQVQSQMVDLGYGLGSVEMFMYMYEKSITEFYMLAYADYPTAYFDYIDPKESLKDVAGGFFGSYGTPTIDEEKEIDVDGNPGRHYKAHVDNNYFVYRTFYVDNRLYQLAMLRDGSYPSDENIERFMESFELIK
ncbi:MAG: hypothetical protein Kow0068_24600 [Marinilabiliales bacterium]